MKVKNSFSVCAVMLCLLLLSSCSSSEGVSSASLSKKLLRFHVVANSDSAEDQALKLKIRDRVLDEIGPKLEDSKSKQEAESIIKENIPAIKKIAQDEISANGKNYGVSVLLGSCSFPAKSYSNIVLPAGVYDALKITLGQGSGKNWWCVMFPPLCFVDISHNLTSEESESRLKTVLSDDEYDSILSGSPEKSSSAVKKPITGGSSSGSESSAGTDDVKLKFKSIEIIKSIFEKLETVFSRK